MRHFLRLAGILLIAAGASMASNISFTGNFTYDTDIAIFRFTLLNDTPGVTLRTWSYVGGTNAAGQVISGGGFEPILNLYVDNGDSTTSPMNVGFAGPCTPSPASPPGVADLLPDPTTGECADVYYPTTQAFPGGIWSAGNYIIALTEAGNQGLGALEDGFFAPVVLGTPVPGNFTCQNQGNPPVNPLTDPFCDAFNPSIERNGSWALDILNVDSASQDGGVPEPGTLAMSLAGAAVLIGKMRSRRRRA